MEFNTVRILRHLVSLFSKSPTDSHRTKCEACLTEKTKEPTHCEWVGYNYLAFYKLYGIRTTIETWDIFETRIGKNEVKMCGNTGSILAQKWFNVHLSGGLTKKLLIIAGVEENPGPELHQDVTGGAGDPDEGPDEQQRRQ